MGKSGSIWAKWLYFDKSGCIWAKVVLLSQTWFYLVKIKWPYFDKILVFGQRRFNLGKSGSILGESGSIWPKLLYLRQSASMCGK